MKVQELLEKYKNNQRIDIAKELEVQQYTSIALKQKMANIILDNCTTIVDGEVHINSLEKYILFTIAVIAMHTNLEFAYLGDDNGENNVTWDAIADYDLLCESGLLLKIIDTFKTDYAACQEVLNMLAVDKMQDNMTIEKKIYKFVDWIENTLGGAVNTITEQLKLDDLVGGLPIDQNTLSNIYNLINKK